LGALVPARESRVVEYKAGGGSYTTNILPTHINKYGSAFLNSSGGTLCIGVNDDGTVRILVDFNLAVVKADCQI
jgi:predicted HTH transcriptional regulator